MEQLRYLRRKQESNRNRRLSSQHVKWKFIMGVNSDRQQYGLPTELQVICALFNTFVNIFKNILF